MGGEKMREEKVLGNGFYDIVPQFIIYTTRPLIYCM